MPLIEDAAVLRAEVLDWYDRHRRQLPWRAPTGGPPDAYRVWVSEVMLQQTRVETVRPYFERWIERFPDLGSLAAASEDEVLKSWEGLGYYSRARNLHKAVREVAARYGGEVPTEPGDFRSLPGVGRYTAGAVMSIAFGREEPLVDGNVRRVFARLLDAPSPRDAELWENASRLVEGERPGDLNQALMELGATVCRPRSPRCEECPVRGRCRAAAAGTVESVPKRKEPRALPVERHGVAVAAQRGELLLVRRPPGGRLAGLWEFPGASLIGGESSKAAALRALRTVVAGEVGIVRSLGTVRHAFTHVRVIYEVFLATVTGRHAGRDSPTSSAWVSRDRLVDFALPRGQHRIAELIPPESGEGEPGSDRRTSSRPHAVARG